MVMERSNPGILGREVVGRKHILVMILLMFRTVSPEVDGLNFTALAVAKEVFFLASSQTLFLLSNPSGE